MRGSGSIPTRGNIFLKFYNPNLHNIARSDRIGFKMKNSNRYYHNVSLTVSPMIMDLFILFAAVGVARMTSLTTKIKYIYLVIIMSGHIFVTMEPILY